MLQLVKGTNNMLNIVFFSLFSSFLAIYMTIVIYSVGI